MITYNEALQLFLDHARVAVGTETVPTLYAEGRVLAEDVVSSIDVPAWDNSQMDGYAVRAADLAAATNASPVNLPVSQRIPAGTAGSALKEGTCARIFTGAPIPPGADTVVAQEDVTVNADGTVRFVKAPKTGEWVRRRACDIASGSVVAHTGRVLESAVLGLMASVGCGYVKVYRHLRVGLFFSGSELVSPGEPLPEGGIYNSNRYTLRALLKRLDCEVHDLGSVPDTLEATREAFEKAAKTADVIISSGGMSVGEEDHIKPAVESLGRIDMWRVALKPGKPVALGEVCGKPFIGLPGNPVSSFVTFLLLARPYILKLQGRADLQAMPVQVRADFEWTKPGTREEFVRVRRNSAGGLDLYHTQNSQVLTSCAWADGLVDIAAGTTVKKGDIVLYYPFGELFK